MSTRAVAFKALRSTDQEMKQSDLSFNNLAITGTGSNSTIFALNTIAEGTTRSTRIGRRIRMRSVYLQFLFGNPVANVDPGAFIRVILLWDKQTNGAEPSWTNVLDLPGTGNPSVELMAPNNLNNSKRFDTLLDARISLFSSVNQTRKGVVWKKYKRLNGITQYNGSAAPVTNIASGSLVLLFATSTETAGSIPFVSGTSRIRWVG